MPKLKRKMYHAGNRLFGSVSEAAKVLRPMMGPGECIPIYRNGPKGSKKLVANLCVNDAGFAYIRKDIV